MSEKKLVLVTGVTGFIAGQVAYSFLKAGYRVRGTVRSSKYDQIVKTVVEPDLEFVKIDDVATSDFTEALKGVYAVIHTASPLPGATDVDDTLKTAIEGARHVLDQAFKLGITKFVVTSSFGAVLDAGLTLGFTGGVLSEKDWGQVTVEEVHAKASDPYYVYFASKILAEKAVWEFARANPTADVATVLPGFVFGPYAPKFPVPANKSQFGTNGLPLLLLHGGKGLGPAPWHVHVKDVADSHVRALELPPSPQDLEAKRFLVNSGTFTWKQAAEHLRKVLPAGVKEKVVDPAELGDLPGPPSTLDNTRAKQVLKIDFIPPEKIAEETILELVEVTKNWS